jgi:hypothetical protein
MPHHRHYRNLIVVVRVDSDYLDLVCQALHIVLVGHGHIGADRLREMTSSQVWEVMEG